MKPESLKVFVEKFQCPGCIHGTNTQCGKYCVTEFGSASTCASHVPGTVDSNGINICLGMPRGFNRLNGAVFERTSSFGTWPILFWEKAPPYDGVYQIAIWAFDKDVDGQRYLFVRVCEPTIGRLRIDVIRDGVVHRDAPLAVNLNANPKFVEHL